MTSFEELDKLPSHELHHRAVKLAEHRHDIAFFWNLLKLIPEAEAVAGNVSEAEQDIVRPRTWLHDFISGGGKLDDALRPVYIDYLLKHEGDAAS